MPEGSIVSGWTRATSVSGGPPTVLAFQRDIIMGCPIKEDGAYQVFVAVNENVSTNSCVSFSVRTFPTPTIVAWEY
jgi:hypothetical protein